MQKAVATLCKNILQFYAKRACKKHIAFAMAYSETVESGRVFSPQNWIKAKASLKDIHRAVIMQISTYKLIPDGKTILEKMQSGLKMEAKDFESRWSAD